MGPYSTPRPVTRDLVLLVDPVWPTIALLERSLDGPII
jgi:hypothetical protein